MKAILVIDTPNDCSKCPLFISKLGETAYCKVGGRYTKKEIEDEENGSLSMHYYGHLLNSKPNNCPLKPMPRKEKGRYWHNGIAKENTYVCGWNECIDEILGEQE